VIAGAEQGALANHIMIVLVIMHRVVRALCQSLVLAVLYEADVQRSLYTLASHLCDIVVNALALRRLSTTIPGIYIRSTALVLIDKNAELTYMLIAILSPK
jgi:hypothetical protein